MAQDARLALATTYGRVTLGKNVQILGPCVLGMPGRGVEPGEAELHIPDGSIIRPFTTIYAGAILGAGFQTGQGTVIREHNVFGEDVCVGSNSVIEGGCTFGSHIRVQGCVSMGEATIEDWVFIGNVVAITDDPHPMRCPHYPCTGGAHIK
jgi:acyl-[acyl carrier protein]--UDP-N-acetylglucosamine O-acyltransferase